MVGDLQVAASGASSVLAHECAVAYGSSVVDNYNGDCFGGHDGHLRLSSVRPHGGGPSDTAGPHFRPLRCLVGLSGLQDVALQAEESARCRGCWHGTGRWLRTGIPRRCLPGSLTYRFPPPFPESSSFSCARASRRSCGPKLWLQFSGGLALRSHSPEGHYQALLAAAPKIAKSSLLHLDSATAKTFPGLKLLATEPGREPVRRLARAYSQHTHKASLLGDSALLSLAAFLLAVVGLEREEDAFWTLVGLVETRLSSLALLQVRPVPGCCEPHCQDTWGEVHGIYHHCDYHSKCLKAHVTSFQEW